MKKWLFTITGLVLPFTYLFVSANVLAECELWDLQRCTSCDELTKTVVLKQPDQGEYYRGAYWNGLYAAYILNCQTVGKKLLDNHANPNLGGSFGSLLVSLANAWPHKNHSINKQWADILIKYSVDVDWKNPFTGMSARSIVEQEMISVDYPDIWNSMINKTKQGAK